jgi:hypothetical protein
LGRFSVGGMVDTLVKVGSRWTSADRKIFHVIHVVELDGHTWVHYEQDNIKECKEYSCYIESFLVKFKEIVK